MLHLRLVEIHDIGNMWTMEKTPYLRVKLS